MLTVAYCRVSTEEQAAEGFSIAGQADKLRVYAELHDLGEVTVIADPGLSGKNLERPGLQQLLHMVDEGHVSNVLTWRLDRLSRNLSDLILLADQFGQRGVALHSFTEKIDLSSATGRMFYNILGSFAQFYREQLAENVRMGMHQAVRQGKWINRPKTGFDLIDGELVPNEMAPVIRRIFAMRGDGASQGDIAAATGVKYSTIISILRSRIYLGEVQMNGEWFPGHHEPLITPEMFSAATRGRIKGRPKGKDLLSGKVRCGMCRRLMALDQNGEGRKMYRCKHRGQGCAQPRRTNVGLLRAAATWWGIWKGNVASCCGCTTTTASGPTFSPRRRRTSRWPSRRRRVNPKRPRPRWTEGTTWRGTSTTWPRCWPLSTSSAHGRPLRRRNDACCSMSFSSASRYYLITST